MLFKISNFMADFRENQGKPGDQAEEEELQLQVAASQEPFEDTQERYAWY